MDDLLTTRQIQELLKVDRITVYRMLQDGRLKGVKIGQQWRFYRSEVDRLVGSEPEKEDALPLKPDPTFPTHCVQTIQDLFADISQISALVVDMNGIELTTISRPNPFHQALAESPQALLACRKTWAEFAHASQEGSKFFTCFSGQNYIGAPIFDRGEQVGLFLAGQFYWQAPDPRFEAERLRRLAETYQLPLERLQQAARSIPVIRPEQQSQVEAWPFSAARAIHSILHERSCFIERLQQIASLTQLS